jgi:hypothetical protein
LQGVKFDNEPKTTYARTTPDSANYSAFLPFGIAGGLGKLTKIDPGEHAASPVRQACYCAGRQPVDPRIEDLAKEKPIFFGPFRRRFRKELAEE